MDAQQQRLKVLIAGVTSLILMLGVARFAYTPLLPVMQQQTELSTLAGGWLATINYVGYLMGALMAASISSLTLKDRLYRIGIVLAVVTTAMMAVTTNPYIWGISRWLAGFSSAAGLLLGSGLILNWLLRHKFRSELGIHFGGVGIGIFFCALVTEASANTIDWSGQWWLFTLLATLLAIPAWLWLPKPDTASANQQQVPPDSPPSKRFVWLMMASYGFAGVAYVVLATFIVALAELQPALQGKGNYAFMLVGLAAAPACIAWDLIARRIGVINALLICYLCQFVSALLPVLEGNLTILVLTSLLYGFTFIGIVSLVLTMAGRFYPSKPAKLMGQMTLMYGIAQIIAPAITGLLASWSGNYQGGLLLAAGAMIAGTLLLKLADRSLSLQDRNCISPASSNDQKTPAR